ncbi:hypothetical protein RZS08_38255, partial [Arthrospira platensis SPKY1]|nr:hypothetical protein [Arthrospira platensis SPKY1]
LKQLYIDSKLGLIIDGTGRDYNKISKQKNEMEQFGYDTFMVFVNTSLEVALERNASRSRAVGEKLVKRFWYAVQSNIGKFQSLFGTNNFIVIDNNKTDENLLNKVFVSVRKFVNVPPKSRIARQWIGA